MRKITFVILVLLISALNTNNVFGQIVISTPNLGFTQACASPSFNTYNVSFTFSPDSALGNSNQFIIELSDASGSFDSSEEIYTSNVGEVISSPASLSFSLPTSIAGEGYRIRIKSTSPVATSTPSVPFAAYYKIQDTPFSINNLIASGVYCPGGSYLLTIDNPGSPENDSPLQYPSLTYNWYKETSSTTSIFIATSETLSVNEPGTYFVETNYGSCTSNSFSNRVTVTEASSDEQFEISSSQGNPFCASEGSTILSAISGESYQWFKDGELISGATDQMYETNESGIYSVNVNLGNCSTDASILLESNGFSSDIDVEEITTLEEGDFFMVTLTTDALDPEYTWFRNGEIIFGENTEELQITEVGNYMATITQTADCNASISYEFRVIEPFPDVGQIPNLISPNGDGINDTWVIPQAYVNGTNTNIKILSSQGKVVFQTTDYQNDWPQNNISFADVNPVYYYIITTENNTTKKGTITIVK